MKQVNFIKFTSILYCKMSLKFFKMSSNCLQMQSNVNKLFWILSSELYVYQLQNHFQISLWYNCVDHKIWKSEMYIQKVILHQTTKSYISYPQKNDTMLLLHPRLILFEFHAFEDSIKHPPFTPPCRMDRILVSRYDCELIVLSDKI